MFRLTQVLVDAKCCNVEDTLEYISYIVVGHQQNIEKK